MVHEPTLLLILDLTGTFVFALAAVGAVVACFSIRMLAVRYHVTAPVPRRGHPPVRP